MVHSTNDDIESGKLCKHGGQETKLEIQIISRVDQHTVSDVNTSVIVQNFAELNVEASGGAYVYRCIYYCKFKRRAVDRREVQFCLN